MIGGASGIGLAAALQLAKKYDKILIADRNKPQINVPANISAIEVDLLTTDFEWLESCGDVDALFYSAGFGRVAPFESLHPKEIDNSFTVNTIGALKVLNFFMPQLKSEKPFYCGIMVSIAGRVASPLFSVYSATKAALFRGIEEINTGLKMQGSENRILEI